MHKSTINFTFEALGQMFDLPEDVQVVGIKEGQGFGQFQVRIISTREPPKFLDIDVDHVKKVGYAYDNPEEFQEDMSKGEVRGAEVEPQEDK